MPTTRDYWDIDGVSLHEDNQNLRSWGGSREEPPPFRGSNEVIPYSYGEEHVAKVPGARTITFEGWMVDKDTTRLRNRWRAFRRLLYRPEEQFSITRRWTGDFGELFTATGKGEYVSGLDPQIQAGGTRLEFKVTVAMPDPFFYGPEVAIELAAAVPKVVTILGDWPTRHVGVDFKGQQSGGAVEVLRGSTVDNRVVYASVPLNGQATVSVDEWAATETVGGSTTDSAYKVSHSGRDRWLHLPLTATVIKYTRASGTGTAVVRYQPAYI